MAANSTSGTEPRNILVIMPYQQLYLPEFEAFGMLDSCNAVVLSGSEDVARKLSDRVQLVKPSYTVLPSGRLLTYRFSFVRGLDGILSALQPSAVFTYELYSTFSYQVSRLRRHKRFVHAVICYETIPAGKALWGKFPPTRLFASAVGRNADVFIALSGRVRDALVSSGVDEAKIRTFYPGIFGVEGADSSREHKRPFRILFIGRLRPNKGIRTMIDAFRILSSTSGGNVELVIAGDGPLQPLVEEAAAGTPGIVFEGFVYGERKSALLASADVFVYPSEDEVYPLGLKRWEEQTAAAVREAMAQGIPVVVSDSGSLPEIVGSKEVVFRQRNAPELAEKLRMFLDSPDLRKRVGRYNLERSRSEFSMTLFSGRLRSVLSPGTAEDGKDF